MNAGNPILCKGVCMFFRLFLLFALIPIVEIYLLIRLGAVIGAINTIVVVIITAMLGAWLARRQGFQTLVNIRAMLARGQVPAEEIVDAFLIFAAGLVLLTPGFMTDVAGFLLLIPQARKRIKKWIKEWLNRWLNRGGGGNIHIYRR